MRVILRVTDSGPISLRAGRETTGAETINYIPGRAVLGGLAEAHASIRRNTSQFNDFFSRMSPLLATCILHPSILMTCKA